MSALEQLLALLDDEYVEGFNWDFKFAEDCELPACILTTPVSVFELAEKSVSISLRTSTYEIPERVKVITRDCTGVRCQSLLFSDSEEGIAKEAARRARQIVPKRKRQTVLRLRGTRYGLKNDGVQA